MESCCSTGPRRPCEPILAGPHPALTVPEPQTQADTLHLMKSPEMRAVPETAAAVGPCPVATPCECMVFRYVPPPARPSAKPARVYCPTKTPFDDKSIYRISYLPVCLRRHASLIKHPDNIVPPPVPMACESTMRFDFPYWGCVERLSSTKPCHRRTVGEGCISDVSTFRDDFRPPRCPVVAPKVYPVPALTTPDVPMEGLSVMRTSYMAPRCTEPRASYKHVLCYNRAPFEDRTLYRTTYLPLPVCRPPRPPWVARNAFPTPDKPMEGVSTYGATYIAPGSFLQVPCSDLNYEKKMEAYDPCRVLGNKPGRIATHPAPFRQYTGLCTAKKIC